MLIHIEQDVNYVLHIFLPIFLSLLLHDTKHSFVIFRCYCLNAFLKSLLECLHDVWMRVTQNEAGGVDHKVQVPVAVNVVNVFALAVVHEYRIWIEIVCGPGAASWKLV